MADSGTLATDLVVRGIKIPAGSTFHDVEPVDDRVFVLARPTVVHGVEVMAGSILEITPFPDDPRRLQCRELLDALRERFRDGMEKYKSGAYSSAIVWESIYGELGRDKGYRLAFDLARAYDELGDAIAAAEHYETYLEKVEARRASGEALNDRA